MPPNPPSSALLQLGWREWVGLPQLGIPHLKAKLDTGARTSALHAYYVRPFKRQGVGFVEFCLHPLQHRQDWSVTACAVVVDKRRVRDSGGHSESRFVIMTPLQVGSDCWDIEITLTNRDPMLFRLLLGRTALAGKITVDPSRSYQLGTHCLKPEITLL